MWVLLEGPPFLEGEFLVRQIRNLISIKMLSVTIFELRV